MTKLDVRSRESGTALALAAAQLEQSTNAEQAFEQVYRIFDICGLGHGCLHALNEDYTPTQALWRVTPDDVTSACSNLVALPDGLPDL